MTVDTLITALQQHLKMDLEIVINDNRSTMLNVLQRRKRSMRLSLHRMFLEAPASVISAVAHLVRTSRTKCKEQNHIVKEYIQRNLPRFDASHRVDRSKLSPKGAVYHLREIFDVLNQSYFEGSLDLMITWYKTPSRKNRQRITFGQYYDNMKLIKINELLDNSFFPDYFVSFIVYHEMLHARIPGHMDEKGRYCVHGKAFKERERLFEHYERAHLWEKQNKNSIFKLK